MDWSDPDARTLRDVRRAVGPHGRPLRWRRAISPSDRGHVLALWEYAAFPTRLCSS
jgi:hypothetical protein